MTAGIGGAEAAGASCALAPAASNATAAPITRLSGLVRRGHILKALLLADSRIIGAKEHRWPGREPSALETQQFVQREVAYTEPVRSQARSPDASRQV